MPAQNVTLNPGLRLWHCLFFYWYQARSFMGALHGNEPLKLRLHLFFFLLEFATLGWRSQADVFGNDLDGWGDGLCTLAFIRGSIAPISVASSYQKHLGGVGWRLLIFPVSVPVTWSLQFSILWLFFSFLVYFSTFGLVLASRASVT